MLLLHVSEYEISRSSCGKCAKCLLKEHEIFTAVHLDIPPPPPDVCAWKRSVHCSSYCVGPYNIISPYHTGIQSLLTCQKIPILIYIITLLFPILLLLAPSLTLCSSGGDEEPPDLGFNGDVDIGGANARTPDKKGPQTVTEAPPAVIDRSNSGASQRSGLNSGVRRIKSSASGRSASLSLEKRRSFDQAVKGKEQLSNGAEEVAALRQSL